MNKLDVALRLLQLLNERKELDTKTVAHELNVSLRTAQRYLMELSAMPCVINGRNSNTYALNPSYPLNKAIVNFDGTGSPDELQKKDTALASLKKSLCLTCGNNRRYFNQAFWSFDDRTVSNKYKIDKLISIITHRLKGDTRSFP